jgi:DNA gyrase subunit A
LGYIKRTPLSDFRTQSRGGMGAKGSDTRDEDFVEYIYPASMHATLLIFTAKGRCYWLKVYNIPEGVKNSKGRAIQNLLNIDKDDKVNAFIRIKHLRSDINFLNSHYLVFCTRQGLIKKTLLRAYSHRRRDGINAITLREGDGLVDVLLTNGHCEILIADRNGHAIRFPESKVRAMGRNAAGVRAMRLDEDDPSDEVVGMICLKDKEQESVLVVSEKGYGKRSDIEDYRITNRGGKGVRTLNITDKTGKLVAIKNVTEENDLMIINKSGIAIRLSVKDLKIQGRATQGVRLINLEKRHDEIASVCKVLSEEEEKAVEEKAANEAAEAKNYVGEEDDNDELNDEMYLDEDAGDESDMDDSADNDEDPEEDK